MTRAYVFIETKAGTARRVAERIEGLQLMPARVLQVDTVTGPFDIIAVVEGADRTGMGVAIAEELHKIAGVEKTVSCFSRQMARGRS
jgi:DNA-binding Lrp family transcriptional regulator